MNEATLPRVAAVFIPEVKPLIPDVAAILVAAEKVEAALAPALARIEANQPAFLEEAEAAGHLAELLPDIGKITRTLRRLGVIAQQYEARLLAAAKS